MSKPYQLGLFGVLLLANVVSAVSVVYAKHVNRKLFVDLQTVESVRDSMDIEWGQLQLEQSTLGTHSEIEHRARKRLNMVMPTHKNVIVIRQ